MRMPMFFAKKQHGMVRISFWRYLTLVQDYVTKVRWVKCGRSSVVERKTASLDVPGSNPGVRSSFI